MHRDLSSIYIFKQCSRKSWGILEFFIRSSVTKRLNNDGQVLLKGSLPSVTEHTVQAQLFVVFIMF